MSIANQIQRIKTNITNAYNEIEKFNVNVSEYNNKSDKLAEAISNITVGETINNQNKTITENGTYFADEGYTGLGEVVVNVDCSSNAEIPVGYTELAYLSKSSGSGYIDLYCKATSNTKMKIKFMLLSYNGTGANGLFGYYSTSAIERYSITIYSTSATIPRAIGTNLGTLSAAYDTSSLNTLYEIEISKDGYYVNGEQIASATDVGSITTPSNCFLYKANNYDTTSFARIYKFQMYESDALIHDFVPVKRNDNGQYGLYDKITGYFYLPNTQTGFSGLKLVKLAINPTPQNATVTLTADEYIQEDSENCICVAEGTEVTYSVSADGYTTQTGTIIAGNTQSIDISLIFENMGGGSGTDTGDDIGW